MSCAYILCVVSTYSEVCLRHFCLVFYFMCCCASSSVMQAIAHADRIFGEDGEGWMVSPFHLETSRRIERWVEEGANVVRWPEFVSGTRRQVFI